MQAPPPLPFKGIPWFYFCLLLGRIYVRYSSFSRITIWHGRWSRGNRGVREGGWLRLSQRKFAGVHYISVPTILKAQDKITLAKYSVLWFFKSLHQGRVSEIIQIGTFLLEQPRSVFKKRTLGYVLGLVGVFTEKQSTSCARATYFPYTDSAHTDFFSIKRWGCCESPWRAGYPQEFCPASLKICWYPLILLGKNNACAMTLGRTQTKSYPLADP